MAVCFIGIGSNLGNRRKNIKAAIKKISAGGAIRRQVRLRRRSACGGKITDRIKVIKISKIRETKPAGGPKNQGKFLNAVLKIKTAMPAHQLLAKLKRIETELGRKKTVRWGPRIIDLDILLYGNRVINRKSLKVPHPRIFERGFVLKPLLEVI